MTFGTFKNKETSKLREFFVLCVFIKWKLYRIGGQQEKNKESGAEKYVVESSSLPQL